MIKDILKQVSTLQIVVNATDLKEAFMEWNAEQARNVAEQPAEKYLTADETAARLGVDVSTLWRWAKNGYLPKVKIGAKKIRYRESDVIKVENGGKA